MRLSTFVVLSSLALALPVGALADEATPPAGGQVNGQSANGEPARPGRPTPEMLQRLEDGRIAFIVAALDLTEEQKPLWAPVADLLRQQDNDHQQGRMGHMGSPDGHPHDLSDILTRHADRLADNAAFDKRLADAVKALEAKLTSEQQETLRVAFFASMPHMPHRMGHPGGMPMGKSAPL